MVSIETNFDVIENRMVPNFGSYLAKTCILLGSANAWGNQIGSANKKTRPV